MRTFSFYKMYEVSLFTWLPGIIVKDHTDFIPLQQGLQVSSQIPATVLHQIQTILLFAFN